MDVPAEVLARMRRASAVGKEYAVEQGIAIAQEMLGEALPVLQGVQVSAPFGRIPLALRVFDVLPGWSGVPDREAVPA